MRAELVKPKVKMEELSDKAGRLTMEPLERGYGMTLGNALRRVLLSSIPGAAVTRVRFDGKYHEYDTIEGVKESVLEIILNLKEVAFRMQDDEPKHIYISFEGEGEVTAGHIERPQGIEVINPDHHLATVAKKGKLGFEMEVELGYGYRSAERNKKKDMPLGVIPVDSDFSSVKVVNYKVEDTRVGERTDYDKLVLEIETNGGVHPQEALQRSAQILIEHFQLLGVLSATMDSVAAPEAAPPQLTMKLEDLGFDKRACNLLEQKGITTLGDLLKKSREELADIHGFGDKTLDKVIIQLQEMGYELPSRMKRG
ncbi:DNA-directed RNA polymerase subunit alpha [Candidatus Acetothermia bacterium]|nr:DNA-directed RNA polymerase subunit alpha [Candidatus Acetothermia bacterium]MBI3459352.1 DNA-directed RNA polymerase subunit alpha [Candidatus Acetothermia bacterium]MBI3659787.1 DNA-directed RNA polymerase subunit alpha [Candidatus Acetothermia bacterium]